MKLQHSFLNFVHFPSKKRHTLNDSYKNSYIFATYGAKISGSVFRIIFLILAVEFESVEASPGFGCKFQYFSTNFQVGNSTNISSFDSFDMESLSNLHTIY